MNAAISGSGAGFPLTANVSSGGYLIRDSPAPLLSGDLARKGYIDTVATAIVDVLND